MKRYAFLTIILLLFAVIALAAPGDKRPAVTSAAIGLGTSSSPTLASITATTSVTAPTFASSAADGYHYIMPYNSIAFAGTPLAGMFVTTPTGPQWYTGSAWEAIGGASAIANLTDWPSGLTATELGYLDGATSNIQAQINAISVGSPVTTVPTYSDQSCTSGQYAFDASYAYFCRATNTWDRIALAGWSNPTPDTTPDAFAFTDETDIAINTAKTSNAITVAGINSAAAISVTGDTGYGYSKNSAACTATSGTVVAGDTVSACVTSSGSNSTATTATVTIGGVSDTYSVTTAAASESLLNSFELDDGEVNLGGTYQYSELVTFATDSTITKISFYGRGGTTGTISVRLMSDADGLPNSVVAEKQANIADSVLSANGWNDFVLSSPTSITAGSYHVVVAVSGATPNVYWRKKYSTSYHDADKNITGTWVLSDTMKMTYRIYGY